MDFTIEDHEDLEILHATDEEIRHCVIQEGSIYLYITLEIYSWGGCFWYVCIRQVHQIGLLQNKTLLSEILKFLRDLKLLIGKSIHIDKMKVSARLDRMKEGISHRSQSLNQPGHIEERLRLKVQVAGLGAVYFCPLDRSVR